MNKFSKNLKNYKKHLLVILCTSLIVLAFFSRLFYPEPSVYLNPEYGQSDSTHYNIPIHKMYSDALKRNELPFWTKSIGTGFPILAESQLGAFFIPSLVLFKFLPFWLALNLSYVIAFILGILGMYYFVRLKVKNDIIAYISGLIYIFSGFFIPHTNHINMIKVATLIPWAFYVYEKYAQTKKPRYFFLMIIIASQQILAGHVQYVLITGVMLISYATIQSDPIKEWKELLKRYIFIASTYLAGLVLSSIQIIPTHELLSLSVRSEGYKLDYILNYSFPPKSILTILNPYIIGNLNDASYEYIKMIRETGNIFWESNTYIGLIGFFAVIVSIKYIKRKEIWSLWVLVILGVLLMLGKYSPLYFVYSIPPLHFFTTPARFVLMTQFFLVFIVAKTLSYITHSRKILISMLMFALADIFIVWYGYGVTIPYSEYIKKPEVVQAIFKDDSFKDNEKRIINFDSGSWVESFEENGWDAKIPYTTYFNEVNPNINYFWNLQHHKSYLGRVYTRRKALYDAPIIGIFSTQEGSSQSTVATRLLAKASTEYVVSTLPLDQISDLKQIYSSQAKTYTGEAYNVYVQTKTQPRFSLSDNVSQVSTFEEFISLMSLPDEEYNSNQTLIEKFEWEDPQPDIELDYTIDVVKDDDLELVLNVDTNKEAVLTIADQYYPGWKGYIDKSEQEIYAANIIQRSMLIPKGQHEVKLQYVPTNFKIGMIITLGGYAIALLAIAVLDYRDR